MVTRKSILVSLLLAFLAVLPLSAQKSSTKKHSGRTLESWVASGVAHYSNGDLSIAEATFSSVLDEDPTNDAAEFYLGMCRLAQKDADGAEKHLSRAVELDPKNFWYRYRLAAFYGMTGRQEVTTRMYEDLLKDFPKKSDLYYNLVDLYISQEKYDDALATMDTIDVVFGKSEATVMTRYQLLLQMQKQDEAYACLQEYNKEDSSPQVLSMLGDYEMSLYRDTTALDYYNEAISLAPDYAPALLGRAEVYRIMRRYATFFPLITDFMGMKEVPSSGKAEYLTALYQRTDPRFQKNWRGQLDDVFETALQTHPADTAILFSSGVYYLGSERMDRADSCFEAIVAAYPDDSKSISTYCSFLSYVKAWDKLIVTAEDAWTKHPDDLNLLAYASMAAYNKGDYRKVIEICQQMESAPSATKDTKVEAISNMGDMYHLLGEASKAYKCYDRALKLKADYIPLLNNYAFYLSMENKQLKKAYSMSKKTVDAEPDNATYLDTFGWILYLQGKYQEAKGIFKHAMLYGGKENATILDHYAEVLYSLKEYDLAFIYWKQAKQQDRNGAIKDLDGRIALRRSQMKK